MIKRSQVIDVARERQGISVLKLSGIADVCFGDETGQLSLLPSLGQEMSGGFPAE